jgi:hypothetical protein
VYCPASYFTLISQLTSTWFPTVRALDPESRQLELMPYSCSEMLFLCQYTAIARLNNSQNPTFVQFQVEISPPSKIIPRVNKKIPPWPDQATVEGSSYTNNMTYTRGSGYSF